jgi:ComF family protein
MISVLPQVTRLKEIALDLLFPRQCVGCGKEGNFICRSCRQGILPIEPPVCPRCGRPQPEAVLCPACINWQSAIDGIRSPLRFDGVIRDAIHEMKYHNLRALAPVLAEFLNDFLAFDPLPADVLVPVPLHPKRLQERGYNQSGLLAYSLSKLNSMPVIDDSLVRRKHTLPQAKTTSAAERRTNIAGAFTCRPGNLRNRRVMLIDDVSTSGATLDACALALKTAGAASVWGLVVAREI